MGMLKKDTSPLGKEELIKIKYKVPPYEYTIVDTKDGKVLVIRSGRNVPDLINDLELLMEKLEEEDIKVAKYAILLGEEESTNVSLSILWSLLDRRRKNDTRIVTELRGKINRNFGYLLFRSENDPQRIYRLAIRVPYSIVDVKEETLPLILNDIEIPREGEIVYIISDDGHLRLRARKFFSILESEGQSVSTSAPTYVEMAQSEEPSPTEMSDLDGFTERFEEETPLETMIEYMPKITKGGRPPIKEQGFETPEGGGRHEVDTEGLKTDDLKIGSDAPIHENEVVGKEVTTEILAKGERSVVDETLVKHDEIIVETHKPPRVAEEKSGIPDTLDDIYRGFVASGCIVERKQGVMDLDFLVHWKPSINATEHVYVAKYMDIWTERAARTLLGYIESYNAEGALLIGKEFPVEVRLFVVGRPMYMIDLDDVLEGRLDLRYITY